MWIFVRSFPSHYWIVAPRAPHVTRPGGFSWRPMQPGRREPPSFEDLLPSTEALIALIDDYAGENHLPASPFDAIGFSQGAAVANTLALQYPRRVRRVGVLAGFVPTGAEKLLQARQLDGIPFFVAHGTLDEMVPVESARRSVQLLQQAGAAVTFCEDEVHHKVSAGCLRGLEAFFA